MDNHHSKHRTRESSSRHHRHHQPVPIENNIGHRRHRSRNEEPLRRIPREIQEPLAGQKDYVSKWLAQTVDEPSTSNPSNKHVNKDIPSRSNETSAHRPKFPQFLQTKGHNHQQLEMEDVDKRGRRKYDLEVSSESSFLERGHAPLTKADKTRKEQASKEDDISEQEEVPRQEERRKRRRSPSPNTEVSPIKDNKREEIFEKRARHKTKEDRYDPKKRAEKEREKMEKKEKKSKRAKKGDRRKESKMPGETLMKNFESKNLANDRLTIRPSHTLGLFKHGRASSPVRRRGLPDLAFSEMEFLQRSHRLADSQPKKPPPKSRKKDRQREDRVFNEISAYFTTGKEPLVEIEDNQQDSVRPNARGQPDMAYGQPYMRQATASSHEDYLQRQRSMSALVDFGERPFLEFGRQASIPTKQRAFKNESPTKETTEKVTDSTSIASGRPTTYLSWSDSQVSLSKGVQPSHVQGYNGQARSSTPESVRRAIAETGVFKHTGLRRNFSSNVNKDVIARLRDLQQDAEHSSLSGQSRDREKSHPDLQGPSGKIHAANSAVDDPQHAQRSGQPSNFDLSRFRADAPPLTIEASREAANNLQTDKRPQAESEAHHYDPEVGWHQGNMELRPESIQHPVETSVPAKQPTRNELAKAAYIRPHSKNTSGNADTGQSKEDPSDIMPVTESPKSSRPATAPPKTTDVPMISRPYSAITASNDNLSNYEMRLLIGLEPRKTSEQLSSEAAQRRAPSQEMFLSQLGEASSLPPLTDCISASSIMRTNSAPSIQATLGFEGMHNIRNEMPEKQQTDQTVHFSLPVRGSSSMVHMTNPAPIHRTSPLVVPGTVYGQRLDQLKIDDLPMRIPSPIYSGDFLLDRNGKETINFAKEEAYIQGLSSRPQGDQNILPYPEFEDIQPDYDLGRSGELTNIGESYLDHRYGVEEQGNFGESFGAPASLRRHELEMNQQNIATDNLWNQWNGPGSQEYLVGKGFRGGEGLIRREAPVTEQQNFVTNNQWHGSGNQEILGGEGFRRVEDILKREAPVIQGYLGGKAFRRDEDVIRREASVMGQQSIVTDNRGIGYGDQGFLGGKGFRREEAVLRREPPEMMLSESELVGFWRPFRQY